MGANTKTRRLVEQLTPTAPSPYIFDYVSTQALLISVSGIPVSTVTACGEHYENGDLQRFIEVFSVLPKTMFLNHRRGILVLQNSEQSGEDFRTILNSSELSTEQKALAFITRFTVALGHNLPVSLIIDRIASKATSEETFVSVATAKDFAFGHIFRGLLSNRIDPIEDPAVLFKLEKQSKFIDTGELVTFKEYVQEIGIPKKYGTNLIEISSMLKEKLNSTVAYSYEDGPIPFMISARDFHKLFNSVLVGYPAELQVWGLKRYLDKKYSADSVERELREFVSRKDDVFIQRAKELLGADPLHKLNRVERTAYRWSVLKHFMTPDELLELNDFLADEGASIKEVFNGINNQAEAAVLAYAWINGGPDVTLGFCKYVASKLREAGVRIDTLLFGVKDTDGNYVTKFVDLGQLVRAVDDTHDMPFEIKMEFAL